MYRLSDIVSKQVISLKGAHVIGTVIDVLFAKELKRADGLLLSDPEENDDKFLKLALSKVYRLDGDAVVVQSLNSPLFPYDGKRNNPAGLIAYGASGKIYGHITDVEWNDECEVTAFFAGENKLLPETLLSYSHELVAFNDTDEKIVLPKFRPQRPKPKDKKIKVKATVDSEAAQTAIATQIISEKEEPTESPISATESLPTGSIAQSYDKATVENGGAAGAETAIVTTPTGALGNKEYDAHTIDTPTTVPKNSSEFGAHDFSFLTGKRVIRALYSSSGRTIAAENSIITPATIADAARENKLVQLALRAGK
ncbi:MAG: hypothetical protein HFK09_02770 [Clostridia bacterium]|nr:hypothetical protein [Clostridia bacterium]